MVKKFSMFYETVSTRSHDWALFQPNEWKMSRYSKRCLPFRFSEEVDSLIIHLSQRITFPAHVFLLHSFMLTISDEQYKLRNSLSSNILQPSVTVLLSDTRVSRYHPVRKHLHPLSLGWAPKLHTCAQCWREWWSGLRISSFFRFMSAGGKLKIIIISNQVFKLQKFDFYSIGGRFESVTRCRL